MTPETRDVINRLIGTLNDIVSCFETGTGGVYVSCIKDVVEEAEALLDEQKVRNCDLPNVIADPEAAYLDDKDNWDDFGSPKLSIEKWMLQPAKKSDQSKACSLTVQKMLKNVCDVLYDIQREYVMLTMAHNQMGDFVGACKTVPIKTMEKFKDRLTEAIDLEWKDVVEIATRKDKE